MTADPTPAAWSVNRRAADTVCRHAHHAADARLLLDMIGLIDGPTGHDILPDDTSPVRLADMGHAPGKAGDEPPLRRAPNEPPARNVTTPPGLRILPPLTAAPAPRKKGPAKAAPAPRAAAQPTRGIEESIARHPAGKKRGGRPRQPIEHGSEKGYKQHGTHGVPIPDDDSCGCRAGAAKAWRDRSAARRIREAARVDHTEQRLAVAVELDAWFAEAQRSPAREVQRAARTAVSALLQLRIAMDDLARAERTAADRLDGAAQ